MRHFEIAVLVGLACSVIGLVLHKKIGFPWLSVVAGLTITATLLHIVAEGPRWQMSPAYVATLLVLVLAYDSTLVPSRWLAPIGLVVLGAALLASFMSSALPVFTLPTPQGPYAIGTQIRHLVDTARNDPFAPDPKTPRELMVQIWYPADPSAAGTIARYRERATTTVRGARFSLVQTHARMDVPILTGKGRFPVLIYAPSWIGVRTENTSLIEQLVSEGYVVVGMDHPYGSEAVAFPDGRVIRTRLDKVEGFSSDALFDQFIATAVQEQKVRAQDASFVLSTLEKLDAGDPDGPLTGHLDLNRVGIFGFSFGGGVAVETAWSDKRFKAGVDMDGMRVGESAESGPPVPFFYMLEDYDPNPDTATEPRQRREMTFDRSQIDQLYRILNKRGGYLLKVKNTLHNNFSDTQLYSPFHVNPELGRVAPGAAESIISRYVLAFFDRHLRSLDRPILTDEPVDTPALTFKHYDIQRAVPDRAHLPVIGE
jgi:predicted dienelactone hydrolase